MKQLVYKGFIQEKCKNGRDDALFIGNMKYPLAKEFENKIQGKQVSVRYWISNTKKTKEKIQESVFKKLIGVVSADYSDIYSEFTGYLMTDEKLNIGGHNLLGELLSYNGKFVYLEIDVF